MSERQGGNTALLDAVRAKFSGTVETLDEYGDIVLVSPVATMHDLLAWLRNEQGFDLLLDIAGVDCLELDDAAERFELEYILYGVSSGRRVRVRVHIPETNLDVPTLTDLWQSANWAEREAYEMFGFHFVGHPCLTRLLTHHEFVGHPLRKDYPVMGGQWCSTSSDLTDELNEDQRGAPR